MIADLETTYIITPLEMISATSMNCSLYLRPHSHLHVHRVFILQGDADAFGKRHRCQPCIRSVLRHLEQSVVGTVAGFGVALRVLAIVEDAEHRTKRSLHTGSNFIVIVDAKNHHQRVFGEHAARRTTFIAHSGDQPELPRNQHH